MREYFSRVRHHAYYTKKEWLALLAVSVVSGFVFSFSKWGYVEFDARTGFQNLILYSIYSFLTYFSIDFARKLYAIRIGMRPEFKAWHLGLLIAVLVSFVSNGTMYVLFLSGFFIQRVEHLIYGRRETGFKIIDAAKIGFYGFLGGFIFCVLLSILVPHFPHLKEAMIVNFWIVLYTAIPLDILTRIGDKRAPISNGTVVFTGSRTLSVFALLLLALGYASIFFVQALWFLIVVFFIALIGAAVWLYKNELDI